MSGSGSLVSAIMKRSLVLAVTFAASIAGAEAQSTGVHPDLKAAFAKDPVGLIVKATSAAAMVKACGGVRIVPAYTATLTLVLADNDRRYGRGESEADIARKVREHHAEIPCRQVLGAFKSGRYKNAFLETAR
jgi:hypothetical protein